MKATQNDLSAGVAKVDFKAMVRTSQNAVGQLTEVISRHLAVIRDTGITKDITKLHLNASWLKSAACELEIAAETLSTLLGAMENREIKIVNL